MPYGTGITGPVRVVDDQFNIIGLFLQTVAMISEKSQATFGKICNAFTDSIWSYSPVVDNIPESAMRAQLLEEVIELKKSIIEKKISFTEEQVSRVYEITSLLVEYTEKITDITSLRTKEALSKYLQTLLDNVDPDAPVTFFENESDALCIADQCKNEAKFTIRKKENFVVNDDQEIRDPCSCGLKFKYCLDHTAEVIFETSGEGNNYSVMECACGGILSLEDVIQIKLRPVPQHAPPAPRKRKIPQEERITNTSLDGLTQRPVKSRKRLLFGQDVTFPK